MTGPAMLARAAVLALLGTAPLYLGDFRTFLLAEILAFGLFAASLDLLLGYAGLPSLGHHAFLGIGAYAAALAALHLTPNALAQTALAAGVATAAAVAVGLVAVRTRGIYFLMLTLALGQLFYQLAFDWNSLTGGSNGLYGMPRPSLGGEAALSDTDATYWYSLAGFLAGYGLLRLLTGSPWGRALAGLRENEPRMRSLGYNVLAYKLAAFAVAGGVAGCAGAIMAQQQRFVSPSIAGFDVLVLVTIAVILGGKGSLLGPVLGAAVVFLLRDQLADHLAQHWPMLLGAVFVLAVYFLPHGIIGAGRSLQAGIRRAFASAAMGWR